MLSCRGTFFDTYLSGAAVGGGPPGVIRLVPWNINTHTPLYIRKYGESRKLPHSETLIRYISANAVLRDLEDRGLKGRDPLGTLMTLPGVVDTSNRDAPGSWEASYRPLMVDGDREIATGETRYSDGNVYSNLFVMRFDGTDVRQLTDNQWEDGTPAWQPVK